MFNALNSFPYLFKTHSAYQPMFVLKQAIGGAANFQFRFIN